MSQVNNDSSLTSVMNSIDGLGSNQSVQMKFALLQLAQSNLCKTQAESYMDQLEKIQEEQKEVADMISKARALQNEAKVNDKCTTMPQEMIDYFKNHGLSYDAAGNDNNHSADEWDFNLKSLTNYQEQIGNKTQTLMVYLQDFIGQYNAYLQGANSQVSTANQTLTNIARGQ